MGTYLSRVFHYASHKRRPLSVSLFMGASLSSLSSSLFCTALLLHMCSKCAYYASAFQWSEGGRAQQKKGHTGNTKRGAFLQSSERQLFALNYKWTRLTPSLASHLCLPMMSGGGSDIKVRIVKVVFRTSMTIPWLAMDYKDFSEIMYYKVADNNSRFSHCF